MLMTVYYLNEDDKKDSEVLTVEHAPTQTESILTRGLQFMDKSTYKNIIIPPHRITKIVY